MKQRKGEAARAYWRGVIEQQARSGQSAAAFCRERGMWPSCFFRWRGKLAREPVRARAEFVEVKAAPVVRTAAGIVIELAGGRRLRVERGFDRELLGELITALEMEA